MFEMTTQRNDSTAQQQHFYEGAAGKAVCLVCGMAPSS